jgi:ABC-type dipeptide/oligopeptide/nickel transport system permease subunit
MLESYVITYVLSTVSDAQTSLATEPWLAVFPGLFIFWIVLSVNLVGDGLSFRGRL